MKGITTDILNKLIKLQAVLEISGQKIDGKQYVHIVIKNQKHYAGAYATKEQWKASEVEILMQMIDEFEWALNHPKRIHIKLERQHTFDKCFECRWALFDGDGIHCQLDNLKNAENCNLFERVDE